MFDRTIELFKPELRDAILIKAYNSGFRYCVIDVTRRNVRLFEHIPVRHPKKEYYFVPDKMEDDLGSILTGKNKLFVPMFPTKLRPVVDNQTVGMLPTSYVIEIKTFLFERFMEKHKGEKL